MFSKMLKVIIFYLTIKIVLCSVIILDERLTTSLCVVHLVNQSGQDNGSRLTSKSQML